MHEEQTAGVGAERRIGQIEGPGFAERVKGAIIWRSGSQIVAQVLTWGSTFLVIRMLSPSDYGLFAMTQVVLMLLTLLNGYGFASALIQSESIDRQRVRQAFGMLLLLNGALAAAQIALAPLAAAYFRQPIVADLLRVQALFYLSTPFIALPNALLSREMDFRKQAKVNFASALAGAGTALACAWLGWGVWTLVAAPMALWWTRAIGMTIAARSLVWPSFRFKGAGHLFRFGGAMMAIQLFWFIQVQADVMIAGRVLDPHQLGIYTTALFLTQILATKFVPPLNEVAFAAYSRIQGERQRMSLAFLKAVRLIMLVSLPFYLGLAATAEPLVLTFLGPKWAETIAIVPLLALAMPVFTLQILFAPATNALGRPGIALRTGAVAATVMPLAFLSGIGWGIEGLAYAWLGGIIVITAATLALSLPPLGVTLGQLGRSLAPGVVAATAMALGVAALDTLLPPMAPQPRFAILLAFGGLLYAGGILLFARSLAEEVAALFRSRGPAAPAL
ncbi:MAG: lipopolysaccharide biosynthesis protein [Allosphingosinicella sp.]|uniref:lipopolysaccharide biosynthesis protein n=1 Tax=Allosphingosinicella sp. TaxID=2823234 RepID=UPI0039540F73